MAVLYRKYRPQTFEEVLNQKYIIQTLINQVKNGQLAHAYLFTGSRGVGKTSVARILAKAANCLRPHDGQPCLKCEVCQQFAANTFLDMVEIDAASNTGVDNIRDLIEHVKFSPTTGKYKVFIIDEVHMLSKGAFNALLKTLEEPPKHVIFILATTEIYKVPATIVSRTQRFDFKRLSVADLEKHLAHIIKEEKLKVKEDVLFLLASQAEGSVRDALSLLDKVLTLGSNSTLEEVQQLIGATDIRISQELVGLILEGKLAEIPPFIEKLTEQGVDFAVLNKDLLEYLRKILVYKMTGGQVEPDLETNHLKTLMGQAQAAGMQDIIYYTRLFLKSYKDLDSAPSPEMPLLLAAGEACLKNQATLTQPAEKKTLKSEKQTVAQGEPKAPETDGDQPAVGKISLAALRLKWPEVINRLKELNGPLGMLVKSSPVVDLQNGCVILQVRFLFHKQNLESPKNQNQIAEICQQVFGERLRVQGQVLKTPDPLPSADPETVLTDALQIFGGELVE